MKPENLIEAIKILTENHSNDIIINKVKANGKCPAEDAPTLHIKNCVPAVIAGLMGAGFMLSMVNGFLEVDDILKVNK